jgi:hypothetical protein
MPGWGADARARAWFAAYLNALRRCDPRMLALAQRELRALGVEVAPVSPERRP